MRKQFLGGEIEINHETAGTTIRYEHSTWWQRLGARCFGWRCDLTTLRLYCWRGKWWMLKGYNK